MRWFMGGVVCGFLAVQAFLPLSSQFTNPHDTRDSFARAMYSDSYVCSARYELGLTGGDRVEVPIVSFSGGRGRATMQRDVVPAFQSWMCSQFTTGAQTTRVHGRVDCRTRLDRFEAVVDPDFCAGGMAGGA
jgi:hypothetical protein